MVRRLNPEKRALLLSTALTLFVKNGVAGTSTAEIASAAGMAAGTLFLYFPTKLDLINTLVLTISQEQSQAVRAALQPDLPPRETFQAIWDSSVDYFIDHMESFLFIHQVRDSGILPDQVAQESSQHLRYYYEAVEKALRADAIKPYPIELIGAMLYQCVVTIINLIRTQPDANLRSLYKRLGFEFFWDGIRASDTSAAQEAQ